MYITTTIKARPMEQLSFDDMFTMMISTDWMRTPELSYQKAIPSRKEYTKTWHCNAIPDRIRAGCHPDVLLRVLQNFNHKYDDLIHSDLSRHYSKFWIPKASGGWREINAPDDEISLAHVELRSIFETYFYASHHANAYAYIKGRSALDAAKVHQRNESKWFLKTDLSGFFPNTTPEFVFNMLSQMYPFCILCESVEGQEELKTALSICFLNGGLPMGTKISPMLTNLIMIPFDYEMTKWLRGQADEDNTSDGKGRKFVWTRYADDMCFSCRIGFNQQDILDHIRYLFDMFQAPWQIKPEKTHYGSSAGRNYILGVMLNEENRLTLGTKKRKTIEAMVFNYLKDRENQTPSSLEQLQYIQGNLCYYKSVDEEGYTALIKKYNNKFHCNVESCISKDMAIA